MHDPQKAARLFGRMVKKGGWMAAYLAALSVKEDNGHGKTSEQQANGEHSPFVSASQFARDAGLDKNTVIAYLKSWDRAADSGIVPPRFTFVGREDINVPLPNDDAEPWKDWHSATINAGRNVSDPDRRAALIASANKDGVGASKVLDVASNKKAVVAAVKADPALAAAIAADDAAALAVHRETNKRHADRVPRRKPERQPFTSLDLLTVSAQIDTIGEVLDKISALHGEGKTLVPEMRDALVLDLERGQRLIATLLAVLTGEIDPRLKDEDLTALLNGGRE